MYVHAYIFTHTVLGSTFLKSLLVKSKGIKFIGILDFAFWPKQPHEVTASCTCFFLFVLHRDSNSSSICFSATFHYCISLRPLAFQKSLKMIALVKLCDLIQTFAFPQEIPVAGVDIVLQHEKLVPDRNWNKLHQNVFCIGHRLQLTPKLIHSPSELGLPRFLW